MGIEADELLIFKNRKISEAKKPKPKTEKQQPILRKPEPSPEPEPSPFRKEAAVQPKTTSPFANFFKNRSSKETKKPEPKSEEPQPILQTPEPSPEPAPPKQPSLLSGLFKREAETQRPEPKAVKPKKEKVHAAEKSKPTPVMTDVTPTPVITEEVLQSAEPFAEPIREEDAARAKMKYGDLTGVGCVNHPWRQAYGICAYCERPFCYPDTIPYDGKLYCLEDIDQISRMPPSGTEKPHAWTYLSSLLFILSAFALGYVVYPSTYFIVQYVQASGINGLINYVLLNYTFPLLDLSAAVLCLISGFVILKNSASAFAFASAVLSAAIILISYEYLSSNASYLFSIIIAMLINLAIIAGGRMNLVGSRKEQPFYGQIDWPKPEVF